MGKSTISMAIFNRYVKLPDGIFRRWEGGNDKPQMRTMVLEYESLHLPHSYGPVLYIHIPAPWSIWAWHDEVNDETYSVKR